jgi:hypothetical protein
MRTWIISAGALIALGAAATFARGDGKDPLIVHEWGTFTSVQGSDGASLEGLQHEEEPLPPFVYSRAKVRDCPLRAAGYKGLEVPATHVTQKMETPVIYFHSKTERRVRVRVDFVKGLLTQWYPVSDLLGPAEGKRDDGPLDVSKVERSFLQWDVDVIPRAQGIEGIKPVAADDPWSFAREVDAACVRTVPRTAPRRGPTESEHYLFYRGLGTFTLPVRVEARPNGSLSFRNDSDHEIPAAFALRIVGKDGSFHPLGKIAPHGQAGAWLATCPSDELTKGGSMSPKAEVVADLSRAVEKALVAQGLFEDEARAMVRTWSRQWFASEGSRVIYLVPRALTDALLPLQISPAPDALVRVLVGRIEYLEPEAEAKILQALVDRKSSDPVARTQAEHELDRLGRFLEPHLRAVIDHIKDGDEIIRSAREVLASLK